MKATIGDMYDIFQKYGDLGIEVNTPYGYKHVEACDVTAKNSKVLTVATTSHSLNCSPNHRIKQANGRFKMAKNLCVGDVIQTNTGTEMLESITTQPYTEDLYDIQVADVKQYYSNGIVSHNSTLLDAVTFCLFDKCSRTYRAKDVLNNKKTKFNCKLTFELNHDTYVVERIAQEHKRTGAVRVDVNFGKFVNGEYLSLNDVDRDSTNRVIRGYIGSYDDFLLTALSTQNDNKNFIFKTQRERKDLLNSFLDISIFDDLYILARNEIKGQQALIKNLELDIAQDTYTQLPEQIDLTQHQFLGISGSFVSTEHDMHELEGVMKLYASQIINVDEVIDIDAVVGQIQAATINKNELTDAVSSYKLTLKLLKSKLKSFNSDLSKFNIDTINESKSKLESLTDEYQQLKEKYARTSTNLKHLREQISHLDTHEYDPECEYCISNPFVQKAEEAKQILPDKESEYIVLKSKLQEVESDISVLGPYVRDSGMKYNALKNSIVETENTISKLQQQQEHNSELIKSIDEKLKHFKHQEKKYHKQEAIQNKNKGIHQKLQELESTYIDSKSTYKELHSQLMEYNSKLTSLKTTYSVWKDKQNQLNNLYDDVSVYETYLSTIAKNGVPHVLLKKILPVIEDEVNSILNQIVEFYVTLEADDKNINCYLHYNEDTHWPVELASGMERFMISIAMRAALINVSSLPRPNFIAIDEGFGVLDSEKIGSVNLLFDYLKTQFDFILCISHLDAMKDLADNLIHVNKSSSGFSEIKMI